MRIMEERLIRAWMPTASRGKIVKWFGYKSHLLVDATYELPAAWTVTKAATADIIEGPHLLEHLHMHHLALLSSTAILTADLIFTHKFLCFSTNVDFAVFRTI